MKVVGDYRVGVGRAALWAALMDPSVLSRVVPGFESLEETEPQTFDGKLMVQVGPVKGRFQGKVVLSELEEPASYRLKMTGRGAPGNVQGEGVVRLTEDGADATTLAYDFDFKIGGKIAGLGQRMLDTTSKAFTGQALKNLARIVEHESAPAAPAEAPASEAAAASGGEAAAAPPSGAAPEATYPAAAPAPAPTKIEAPSQSEFAAAIAKEVAADMIPPGLIMGLAFGGVAGFLAGFLLRHYTG